MTEQTEPIEIISMEECKARVETGTAISPATLVLIPIETLRAISEHLDDLQSTLQLREEGR